MHLCAFPHNLLFSLLPTPNYIYLMFLTNAKKNKMLGIKKQTNKQAGSAVILIGFNKVIISTAKIGVFCCCCFGRDSAKGCNFSLIPSAFPPFCLEAKSVLLMDYE